METLFYDYLVPAAGAILLLLAAWIVATWIRRLIRNSLKDTNFDLTLTRFFSNIAYYAILIFAALGALSAFGVGVASFAAVLAAAGFAVGLALQGSLSNFAAGVMLLIFRPFKVGDYIEVADETGFVHEIQLFYTIIDTRSNRRIIVPNGDVFGNTIENIFFHDAIRVDVAVGTDYPADIDETRQVLETAAASVQGRLEDRGVQVALQELGGSSINWEVRIWSDPDSYFKLKQELTRAVKYALDDAGIGIPYPQMDVHLDQLN
jgi:small conductance mechanosensitive channel